VSLAVAAVPPPSAIYREEQWFGWWIYAVLGLISALAWLVLFDRTLGWNDPMMRFHGRGFKSLVVAGLVLPPSLIVGALRMVTLVIPTELRISFGFLATFRRVVPLDLIQAVEVVHYHPIRSFGGWGIRIGRDGERVYNARGDRGVRIHLHDGTKMLVGSQRPEQLALAIEAARRPGM